MNNDDDLFNVNNNDIMKKEQDFDSSEQYFNLTPLQNKLKDSKVRITFQK